MALINDLNKSEEEIAKEMIDAMPDKYQKTVGFYTWDILRAISKSIIGIWDKLKYIANLDDLSNMELEDLIVFVKERRGIDYKSATKSSGKLKVTAGYGTIQKGDLFQTEDGTQFQAVETQTVEEGGFFSVECLIEGIEGNVPENSITIIPATIVPIVVPISPKLISDNIPLNPSARDRPTAPQSSVVTMPRSVSQAIMNLFPINRPSSNQSTSSTSPLNPAENLFPRFTQSIPSIS